MKKPEENKSEIPSYDWSKMQKALDDLPPEIRNRIEVPLRATNPRMFLMTLKKLHDQLGESIKRLEEVTGGDTSADISKGG